MQPAPPTGRARLIWLLVAWLFVGLATLGAFLPLLPTVPLLLVALWAASKSSPRLHAWLWNHPRFGPVAREWRAHRVIPLRAKLIALPAMAASLLWTFVTAGTPLWAKAAATLFIAACAIAILSCPSRPPPPPDDKPPR